MKEYMKQKRLKDKEAKAKDNVEILRKLEATKEGTNIVADVFNNVLNEIPVKRNRGRPIGSKNKKKEIK